MVTTIMKVCQPQWPQHLSQTIGHFHWLVLHDPVGRRGRQGRAARCARCKKRVQTQMGNLDGTIPQVPTPTPTKQPVRTA